ncbi:MAG: hypothetical protein AB2L20_00260 [Mangrovibacterium sp.]
METIIRIKSSELTIDFLDRIKELFKNENTLEISISPVPDFGLTKKESHKAYMDRINKAIDNLESRRDTIAFSEDEFKSFSDDLLNDK